MKAGDVYSECAVDRKAFMRTAPDPNLRDYRPAAGLKCLYAYIDVVVDTAGAPVMSTVKIDRTNDNRWADVVVEALGDSRFTPAQKQGHPVMQLYRYSYKAKLVSMQVAGIAPATPNREPTC